jgi:hypothetical protein
MLYGYMVHSQQFSLHQTGVQAMADEPGKFMTMQETMDALHLSRSAIDLYAREGKLKRFAVGKNTMFLREQVEGLKVPKPKLPRKRNQ